MLDTIISPLDIALAQPHFQTQVFKDCFDTIQQVFEIRPEYRGDRFTCWAVDCRKIQGVTHGRLLVGFYADGSKIEMELKPAEAHIFIYSELLPIVSINNMLRHADKVIPIKRTTANGDTEAIVHFVNAKLRCRLVSGDDSYRFEGDTKSTFVRLQPLTHRY